MHENLLKELYTSIIVTTSNKNIKGKNSKNSHISKYDKYVETFFSSFQSFPIFIGLYIKIVIYKNIQLHEI